MLADRLPRRAGPAPASVSRVRPSPNVIEVVLWVGLIGLVVLGIASVALRWFFPFAAAAQLEPLRQSILDGVSPGLRPTAQRAAELAHFDGRYGIHLFATLTHILPSGVFLALVPMQLSRPVRTRFPALHRWTGRALMMLAVAIGVSALYFGVGMPFAGLGEALIIVPVSVWFFTAILRAYVSIRRRDVARHREWMLRAVAAAIGVSTVRVVGAIVDVTLTPLGMRPVDAFVVSLWVGWIATLVVTEWWIRRTRPGHS